MGTQKQNYWKFKFCLGLQFKRLLLKSMRANMGKNIKQGVTYDFQDVGMVSQSEVTHNDDADIKHFLKQIETLNLPEVKNQPQIDKIKKRIDAFAKQYGQKTQKTTSIFMNYLQTVRETGVSYLKNNDLLKAASYFAECLRFVDPKYDEIFYEKFLIVKIDAINKLMYCLFQLESQKNREFSNEDQRDFKVSDRYQNAERILTQFLQEIHEFQKIESLKRSENCMLQVNYFYLGRLRRKNSNKQKAIEAFKQSLALIQSKQNSKYSTRDQQIHAFLHNLRVKIFYKLSKCYRQLKNTQMQRFYETTALKTANQLNNLKLQYYIHRKIQFYQGKQQFLERLGKLQGKRRIQEQITKLIDQSKQTEIKSLYNVYNYQQLNFK